LCLCLCACARRSEQRMLDSAAPADSLPLSLLSLSFLSSLFASFPLSLSVCLSLCLTLSDYLAQLSLSHTHSHSHSHSLAFALALFLSLALFFCPSLPLSLYRSATTLRRRASNSNYTMRLPYPACTRSTHLAARSLCVCLCVFFFVFVCVCVLLKPFFFCTLPSGPPSAALSLYMACTLLTDA
jgi:hypothetical protein